MSLPSSADKPVQSVLHRVTPREAGLCPQRTERLLTVLRREVARQRLPGAVAVIARRGRLALHEAVGALDPAAGTPMTPDAIFRI